MSDRGRGSIGDYVGNVVYNIVALGMLAMVSGIKMFSGPERLVFYREASAGLSKLAYFWALDTWGHVGLLLRCAVYLSMYYSFSQPRAVLWQMYMVTCAIYYACTGMAYGLSQVMSPNAAQLTAAVAALINALVASKFSTSGVMGLLNKISYTRWGLEGYVIAETNYLTGVWLLARCADLKWMQYDINQFWYCIKMLMYIGCGSRIAACLGLLLLHKDKTL